MPDLFSRKLISYARLMRWHKPIGIFLLLWPTLWGLWVANNSVPPLKILLIFCLGVVLMRSAGCVVNDIADRNFDGAVARTRDRPLVTGVVSLIEAILLFSLLCSLALILVWQLNAFTILLAIIGALLTCLYPFAKRFTYFPQVILGITFGGWPVLMAFAASINALPPIAWYLFVAASLWPMAYDTMYAMVDREDDQKIGIKSTALILGRWDRAVIAILQIIILILLCFIGQTLALKNIFYFASTLAFLLAVYQHYLIKNRQPTKCFKAFLNNNWFGLIIWLGFLFGF